MNASKILKLSLLLTSAMTMQVATQVASASTDTISKSSARMEKPAANSATEQYREALSQANKMLGYVNLAYLATDLNLTDRAVADITAAQIIASQLEKNAPTFVSESKLKYGKLTYDIKGEERNYYIPVLDDVFVVRDYDGIFKSASVLDIVERDARLVNARLDIDIRQVNTALKNALNDVKNERLNSAKVALSEIYQGALTDESEIETPIWAIHDNLKLSQNLISNQQYDSVQFALEHARESLNALEQSDQSIPDATTMKKLDGEIMAMEKQLRANKPGMLHKAELKINQWLHTVDGWFTDSDRKAS